jgi:hypothetical protein
VTAIGQTLYGLNVIYPFPWMRWDRAGRYRDPASLADAPAADTARLATAIFRGERFGDGEIARALDDGILAAILARLPRWHEPERARWPPR